MFERMQPLAANHLVLEVAADRACRREPHDIGGPLFGVVGVGPLEIDRQGQVDRVGDPLRIGEREVDRHVLAVGPSLCIGHRMASRCERLRTGLHHRHRAADIPDIVEDDRVARHVESRELLELAAHQIRSG